ncbi:MAG: hypothetical protein V3V15_10240 [Sphingorhabdus sp.]
MNKTALFTLSAIAAIAGACGTIALAHGGKHSEKSTIKAVGEPIKCVRLHAISSTDVVDGKTIDFKMRGGKTYRNTLDRKCPGLKSEERFSYRTSLGQLCDVDIIHVLHNYSGTLEKGASCSLGKFQYIEKISAK